MRTRILWGLGIGAFVAAGLGAACSSDEPAGTTTSGPPITAIFTDYETQWSPAWEIPATLTDLEEALGTTESWLLVPTTPPTPGADPADAEVRVSHTVPDGRPQINLTVRATDLSVLLSLQAIDSSGASICDGVLAVEDSEWIPESIRAAEGCILPVDGAVSFFAWTENGQDFVAQLGPDGDLEELISWVADWQVIGSP